MKPTERQIKAIDTIVSIVKSWKNTNDFYSPTLDSDIHEELFGLWCDDISSEDIDNLSTELEDLFMRIKEIE